MDQTELFNIAKGAMVTVAVAGVVGFLGAQIVGIFMAVKKISISLDRLVATNDTQTQNIATVLNVSRYTIRAGKYNSAALRELGANGSVARANECWDAAEKAMERRTQRNDETSMGGCRREDDGVFV